MRGCYRDRLWWTGRVSELNFQSSKRAAEANYLFTANSFSSTYPYVHTKCEYQSDSSLTRYHGDLQYISEHEWQDAEEDGRGSQCRHILWQSVHCDVEQVSANLRQIHQSTATGSSRWRQEELECWETDFVNVEPLSYMQVSTHTAPARSFSPSVAALKCNSSICLFTYHTNWTTRLIPWPNNICHLSGTGSYRAKESMTSSVFIYIYKCSFHPNYGNTLSHVL